MWKDARKPKAIPGDPAQQPCTSLVHITPAQLHRTAMRQTGGTGNKSNGKRQQGVGSAANHIHTKTQDHL
jgi:hypothetical protein